MGTVRPTTAVATISPAQLKETITVLHGRLAEMEGQPNRYCVPRALAATIIERRQLSAACAHLEARLEPCHDKLVIEAVLSQFLIPYDTARRMVVRGFLGQLVEKIDLPQIQERVLAAIDEELDR